MSEKIPIKDILAAIDTGSKEIWDELTSDQQKAIPFFLLNRYVSSVSGSADVQKLAILYTNEYFNKHYLLFSKNPKIMWITLCALGKRLHNKIKFHPYIGFKTDTLSLDKQKQNYRKKLRELYPSAKSVDIDSYVVIESNENIKQLILDHGREI